MTLTRLTLAWAVVVPIFLVSGWLASGRKLNAAAILVLLAEALACTLLAGLWFASLGSGGWWLVFGLVGLIAGGAERGLQAAVLRSAASREALGTLGGAARYLVAGAVLAWLLG